RLNKIFKRLIAPARVVGARRHGVSGEQLETLMIGNPQRVFGG
ncbi:hypothetical protein ACLBP9_23290, partial [Klebsiella pneumoniae]